MTIEPPNLKIGYKREIILLPRQHGKTQAYKKFKEDLKKIQEAGHGPNGANTS